MDKSTKKQLIAEYKLQRPVGGVCKISNKVTGTTYIKADSNIKAFENRFRFSQKTDSCIVLKLQDEWKKYGGDCFIFEILEEIEMKENENQKEFIDRLKECEQKYW
jgi:hypothetical protein